MKKYKVDLSINKYKVDDEILEQAQRYYGWSNIAVEAEIERDNAKDDYNFECSRIEKEIREKYQNSKSSITESGIKNKIATNKIIIQKYNEFRKARDNYNYLSRIEKAFDQRKKMLESFVIYITRNINADVKTKIKEQRKIYDMEGKEDIKKQLKKIDGLKRRSNKNG